MNILYLIILLLALRASGSPIPLRALSGEDLTQSKPVTVEFTKPTVVVFMGIDCPCSKSHEAHLKELALSYPEYRFVAIHSNSGEAPDKVRAHFSRAGLGFPVFQDTERQWAKTFGALKTPHAFIIAPDGNFLFVGAPTDSHLIENAKKFYLRDALAALRAGKPIPEPSVRPLGCLIR